MKSGSISLSKPRRINAATGRLLLLILLFTGFAGCAGYRLGPTNGAPAGSRSLQVNMFRNETWEPRLSEPVATSLRRWVQRDGTYRLATQNDADVILSGELVEFNRSGVSFQPRDVRTLRDYELTLTAHVVATERGTGRELLNTKVTGRATIRVTADEASAERQAAPLLAEDLSRRIISLLVDGSW